MTAPYLVPAGLDKGRKVCPECKGTGDVPAQTQEFGPDDYVVDITCPQCNGTGIIDDARDP